MENQNQQQSGITVDDDNGKGPVSSSLGITPAPADYNPDSLSLINPEAVETLTSEQVAKQPSRPRNLLVKAAKRADLALAVLLILSVGGVLLVTSSRSPAENKVAQNDVASKYETQNVPLSGFVTTDDGLTFEPRSVAINGVLKINGGIVITPSLQPNSPQTGQLYYDQTSNQLGYYNGSEFVLMPPEEGAVVQSLGGLSGQVGLAGGLAVVGNQLVNAGVLSLGGANGAIVLGDGLSLSNNVLQNTGVLNVTAGTPNVAIANNGSGSFSVSVTGSGTGTVGSGGGTAGIIPVFTASQNIEDSVISQSGSNVTVGGGLSVTGALTLGSALTVANGGTGAGSLTANGVIVGNGTSALSSVAAGGAGLCLISTVGAPVWGACSGGGGVTSLNGLSGALSIANASGVGSTVTIDDASTIAKGIASFNGTNFSVASGAVNTIQNINTAATPTFAGVNTNNITPGAALTVGISAQTALLQGSTTTITSSGAGNDIVLNSADTIELQDNTNVTGNIVTSGDVAVNGGDVTSTGALNITPGGALVVGAAAQNLTLQGNASTSLRATNGANTTIVGFTSPTANTTLNFPALSAGTYSVCTTSGNCAGAGVTLQAAYDNSSTPEIVLDATRGALTIRDNASALGANLLEVQNNGGGTTYLAVTATGTTVTGTATISGNINSSGGSLQTANTTRIDNSGNATNIGSLTLSGAISGGTSFTGSGNINTTGGVIQTANTTRVDNSGNLVNIAAVTASGSATFQGGSVTLGTGVQAGTVVFNDGSSNTGTLQVAALGQNTVYTLPDPGVGTATVCISTGNCAGTGGGVTTPGGTPNTVPKFTGAQTIGDSIITDNGTTVTIGGTLAANTITPTGAFTAGAAGQTTTLQGSITTITSAGGNDIILNSADTIELQDSTNVSGNLDVSGTITAATGNAFQVDSSGNVTSGTVNGQTISATASFTGTVTVATGFTLTSGNLAVSSGNITASGNATLQGGTVTIGTTSQAGSLVLHDGNGQTATVSVGDLAANRALTIPVATGSDTFCLQTLANCSGTAVSLQGAYDNSTSPEIVLDATRAALTIRDNSSAIGGNLFEVQNNAGGTTYFGVTATGVSVTGTATATGNINSTGGSLQTANTTRIDNSGNATNIGNIGLSGTISGGTTYTGSGDINTSGGALQTAGTARVDNGGNLVNIGNLTATGAITVASSGAGSDVIIDGADQFIVQDAAVVNSSAAFNGLATFNTDVDLALGETENLSITNTVTGTNSVNVIGAVLTNNSTSGTQQVAVLQNAAGSGATEGLLVLDNADTDTAVTSGLQITSAAGGITNAVDVSDPDIATALLFGANDITGTNFSVTGSTGSFTSAGNATVQGGTVAAGTSSQAGTLVVHDGSSNTGTLQTAALGQNTVYNLPDPGTGTVTICVSTGNCAGSGSGVTTSGGTPDRLAKFTAGQNIEDSSISDDGTNVTTTADLIVQGGDVTVGTSSQLASFLLHDGNGQTTTLRAGDSVGNLTFILPTTTGSANQCLKQSGTGNQLVWDACDGGGGGTSASLQSAYDDGNTITTTSARDIAFTLSAVGTDSNFTVTVADDATGFVSISRADGSGTNDPAQLVLLDNLDATRPVAAGIKLQASAGGLTTAVDASDAEIVDAFNAGANNIVGTTGDLNFSNFDVVGSTGNVTAGTYNGQTITSAASFTGTVTVATDLTLTAGDIAVNGGNITSSGTLSIDPGGAFTAGATGQTTLLRGSTVTLASNGASNDIIINSADTIELQDNTNVTGNLAATGTYNTNTFTGSALTFGSAATATIQSAASQALTLTANASSTWSTSAGDLTVQAATNLNLRAAGGNIMLGTSDTTGTLLVVDVKTDAGDPAGTDGAIYYNSNSGTFRCYQSGAWANCITASGGFVSLQNAYDNGNTIATDASGDISFTLNNQNFTVATAAGATGSTTFSLTDGSNATPPAQLVLITNNDTNQALASGLKITSAAGTITTAIDVSGSNMTNAIDIGTNNIVSGGVSISSTELNRLDGHDAALVDTNDAVATAITGTGALNSGSITSGFGAIDTGADNITTTGALQGSTAILTGANALTLGTASTNTGAIVLRGSGGAGTLTLSGPTTPNVGNFTLSLPAIGGNATVCTTDTICAGYQASGSYANTALSNLSGVAINTSLLTGSATIDLGSNANPFRDLYLGGTATNNFRFTGTAAAARTITLDDLSGRLGLIQTAGSSTAQTGDLNVSGTLIAGTALQGTLVKSADTTGASSAITMRSGNSTTSGNTGGVTVISGNATSGDSGNVSIDSGTASGTTGTVGIGTTNASGLTLGRSGLTTANAGALTVTQLLTANGGATIAANQNLTLANGTGVLGQTFTNGSASSAQTLSVTNSNSGGSSVAVNGSQITLVGTATSGGVNSNSAFNFANPSAVANNNFYGLNFAGTGYTDILRVNGTQIINGSGVLQNAGLSSGVNYSNLTQVGTLTSGALGAGFTTVAVAQGGTGATTFTSNGVLYGNGTGAVQATSPGTTGQCLVGNTGAAPSWLTCGALVSLQNAYDNGNTISTDATGDIAFTLNNQNFTVATAAGATGSTAFSLTDGSNATPPTQLVSITNNDVNQILANGLVIASAAGGITDGLDVSDADLVNALNIGANDILSNGVTISSAELNLLDGRDAALVDINDAVNTAITGTGALSTGSIASGFGAISTGNNIATTAAVQGGTAVFTGANALTLGTSSTNTGAIVLRGSGGAGTLTLSGPTTPNASNYTLSLPAIGGNATVCTTDTVCAGYQASGSYANTALSNLSGVAINTSLLSGSATIDLGSNANPFRDLYVGGTATNNFRFTGTAGAARTITMDDLSGRLGLIQTAGSSSAQTGDLNVSGTLIAGTALQGTLIKSADGTGASSAVTLRSGNSTTSGNTGGLTIVTGAATSGNSGNISIDAGTASGTTGTITIAGTQASALTLGRSGLTTTNAGALTATQLLTGNGGISVGANQNVTLQDGTGELRFDTDGQVYIDEFGSTDTDIMELFGRVGFEFYVNTGQEVLTVSQNGFTTVRAGNNANGGFAVVQSNDNPVFSVGTEDNEGSVTLGYASDSAATVLYLDGDATSEPTGGEGGMYYNNSTNKFRCYQNSGWTDCITTDTGVTTVGAFSGSSQPNGATISGNTITFGPADGTNPGMVSTGVQTFAGAKTFASNVTIQGTGGLTFNTGAGGDITFANNEKIDNDTDGTINLSANSGAISLLLTGTAASINNSAGTLTLDSFNNTLTIAASDTTLSATGLTALNLGTNTSINSGGTITLDATSTVIIPGADTFQSDDVTSTGALALVSASNNAINVNPNGTGDVVFTHANDSQHAINTATSTDLSLNLVDITSTNSSAASTGTLNLLAVRNLNEAGSATGTPDSLIYATNLDANETVTNGMLLEQATAGGTLTNGIQILQSAGTLGTGIKLTGTFSTAGIDAGNSTFINIGNANTDFNSSGGLTLAENLVVQGTGGLTFNTGAGGDITFANNEKIDNDTDGTINLQANSGALTVLLTGTAGTISNSAGNLTLNSASGRLVVSTGDFLSTSVAGVAGAAAGDIWYDSTAQKYKINENGTTKTLCNLTDLACGAGATTPLQTAYNDDVDGSDAIIALTTADDSIILRNPAASGTDSGYVLGIDQLNTGAVDGLRVSTVGTGLGQLVTLANTAGTQTNGVLIDRNGSGGTTTNGINITNTLGTLTNGLAFTGTIGTDIQRASGTLSMNGATSITLAAGGTLKATIGASNVTLGTDIDLLLQGTDSFISNTKGQANSEAFGAGALVGSTEALAVGAGADASSNETTAIGRSAVASSSGAVALGKSAFAQENDSIALGMDAWANGLGGIALGTSASVQHQDSIALGEGAATTATNQLVVGSSSQTISQVLIGNGVTSATPSGFTLQGTGGSGTDIAGAGVTIAGGRGTGAGNGGNINLQIADPGSTGSGLNALATVFSLSGINGAALLQNTTDSATAFRVQNSGATATILDVDTTNQRLGINTAAPTSTFQVNQSNLTPGTVSNSASSANVTGSSTTFLATFQPGDTFTVTSSGNSCIVQQITSDTALICRAVLASSSSGSAYSFTQQVRAAVANNGTTSLNGTVILSNPSTNNQFTFRNDEATNTLTIGASIIGNASNDGASDSNASYIQATKFNSGTGGTINSLRVFFPSVDGGNPGFKVAVYSDSAGSPNTLLSSATAPSTTATAGVWSTAPLGTTVTLVPNTTYWLATSQQSGSTTFGIQNIGTNTTKYQSGFTYGSNFPGTYTVTDTTGHIISIYAPYTTITDQSAVSAALTITENNEVGVKPIYDSEEAFAVYTADGTQTFNVNTLDRWAGSEQFMVGAVDTNYTFYVRGGDSAGAIAGWRDTSTATDSIMELISNIGGTGTLKLKVTADGNISLAGGGTKNITTVAASTAAALGIKPGDSTGSNATGAAASFRGGDATSTTCGTACTGGAVTLQAGSATGASGTTRNGGAVSIEGGTGATANGAINIGTVNASAITMGQTTTASVTTIQAGTNVVLQSSGAASVGRVQIGAGGAGSTTPDYFALDVKSDTGDPGGGAEGYMYYNTADNKFRCFQGAAWTDCIGAGGSSDLDTVYDNDSDKELLIDSATGLLFDMTTTGDFLIQDSNATIATFDDSGGITLAPNGTSDMTLTLDDDSTLVLNGTVTNSGHLQDINLTLGNDSGADTVSALNIDVTSTATGDADFLYGLSIGALTSPDAGVSEYALNIGSNWDKAIQANGTVTIGTGTEEANLEVYGEITQEAITKQTGLTNITDTFVYDTTSDSDGGAWTNSRTAQSLSWYTESKDDGIGDACVIASDDRCGSSRFPRKALIVSTTSAVYIFDTSTNKLFMKFNQNASGYAIGVDTSNDPSSVFALNGVVYVGANGGSAGGMYALDFVNDKLFNFNTTDRDQGDKNIANRNTAVAYATDSRTAMSIRSNVVNGVHGAVLFGSSSLETSGGAGNGQTYIAAATDDSISVVNLSAQVTLDYGDNLTDQFSSVWVTKRGRMYGLNATLAQIERYGSGINSTTAIDTAKIDQTTPDKLWDEAAATASYPNPFKTAPTFAIGAPDALKVAERQSFASDTFDILYVGHSLGLTEIHDVSGSVATQLGWSKYTTISGQTALMSGTPRGMFNFDETSGDLTDATIRNSVLEPEVAPTYGVPGVSGTGLRFNGSSQFLCSDANNDGTCDTDTDFNNTTISFHVSLWFKHVASLAGTDVLVDKRYATLGGTEGIGYTIEMDSGGLINFGIQDTAATSAYDDSVSTTVQYNDNQWHHLVAVNTDTALCLYIDGKLTGTCDTSLAATGTLDASQILTVGADASGASGGNFWEGDIDDLYIAGGGATTSDTLNHAQIRKMFLYGRSQLAHPYTNVTNATTATSTTLGDSGEAYVPNSFVGSFVEIVGGTGVGQTRRIIANDATTFTVSPAFTVTPDTTSDYQVAPEQLYGSSNVVSAVGMGYVNTFLGTSQTIYAGTNDGSDGGGVTAFGGFGGSFVSELFHSEAALTDTAGNSWSGTDADDIKSLDTENGVITVGSLANMWTEASDRNVMASIDSILNNIGAIRAEAVANGMAGTSNETGGVGGADLAEYYISQDGLEAGDIVALEPNNPGAVRKVTESYDKNVIGIVATAPGIILGPHDPDSYPVALVGRVPVKVTTENGSIKSGDRITSASIDGYGMKATQAGRVLGTALEDLGEGTYTTCPEGTNPEIQCGSIMVFVNLVDFSGQSVDLAVEEAEAAGLLVGESILDPISALLEQENGLTTDEVAAQRARIAKADKILRYLAGRNTTGQQGAEVLADRVSTGELNTENAFARSIMTIDLKVGGGLVVGGNAAFHGDVVFAKTVTLKSNVNLKGHFLTSGGTPTVTTEVGAGEAVAPVGAPGATTASATVSGNDSTGQLRLRLGQGFSAGKALRLNFHTAYDQPPSIVLTPTSGAAAQTQYYVESSAEGFILHLINPQTVGADLSFSYWVVGQEGLTVAAP